MGLLRVQLSCSSSFPKELLEGRQRWGNTRSCPDFFLNFNLTSRVWTTEVFHNLRDFMSWCHLPEETFIPLFHSSVPSEMLCHFIQATGLFFWFLMYFVFPKTPPQPLAKLLLDALSVLMSCVAADVLAGGSSPLVQTSWGHLDVCEESTVVRSPQRATQRVLW